MNQEVRERLAIDLKECRIRYAALDVKAGPGSLWCNSSQIHVSPLDYNRVEKRKRAPAPQSLLAPRSLDALLQ